MKTQQNNPSTRSRSLRMTEGVINDESILVIKSSELKLWQGLKTDSCDTLLNLINAKKEFHWRSIMETDENYKQVIPYLIFQFQDLFFVMQRKETASEQRLKNKLSIGIGGHIRKEDISSKSLFDWARREFAEEINYDGKFETELIGALNDDSNSVGKVHLGIVFLLKGDSDQIKVRSELKSGYLVKKEDLETLVPKIETWSKIVSQYLIGFF